MPTNGWIDKETWYIHTMDYSNLEKEGNPASMQQHNEPEGYYAKWNKPVKEQKLYDFTYMRYLK